MTPIFHITNVRNLAGIIGEGGLLCDSKVAAGKVGVVGIAHQHIKDRRSRRPVPVGWRGMVCDYVPFYFAPRSPMLFAIDRGIVEGYMDGQSKVVHLVSSVERVFKLGLPYCFSDGHAEMGPTLFFDDWNTHSDKVPWDVMELTYWNDTPADPDRKRRRQAEFLVHGTFPWGAVESIGVYNAVIQAEVTRIISGPTAVPVKICPTWYY